MESTSETVQWEEKTNLSLSKVTKKCVQEVSATSIEKLSSTTLDSDNPIEGHLVNDIIKTASPGTMELSLRPMVNSLQSPESENIVEDTCLQNELIAMAIKDEHSTEIGQLMQQKLQAINSSSFESIVDSGDKSTSLTQMSTAKSSSIMQQMSSSAVVAGIQETSSSLSSYKSAQKQEFVSSSTRSLSSIQSSTEKIVKSSNAVVGNQ